MQTSTIFLIELVVSPHNTTKQNYSPPSPATQLLQQSTVYIQPEEEEDD